MLSRTWYGYGRVSDQGLDIGVPSAWVCECVSEYLARGGDDVLGGHAHLVEQAPRHGHGGALLVDELVADGQLELQLHLLAVLDPLLHRQNLRVWGAYRGDAQLSNTFQEATAPAVGPPSRHKKSSNRLGGPSQIASWASGRSGRCGGGV